MSTAVDDGQNDEPRSVQLLESSERFREEFVSKTYALTLVPGPDALFQRQLAEIVIHARKHMLLADREQVVARGSELIVLSAPAGLRCGLNDTKLFELLQSLCEQRTGESGRTLQDFTEASAAKVQVADDQAPH